MTHLPLTDRNVWGVGGVRYRPEYVCSHPACDKRYDLELHHIWPRSFLRNQPRDWVKLPDGKVIGNLVWLCAPHHILISENKERIEWLETEAMFPAGFYWQDEVGCSTPLSPQPPLSQSEISDDSGLRETPRIASTKLSELSAAIVGGHERFGVPVEKTSSAIWEPISPGENCPRCGKRQPHPKKENSPKTTVTKSWRLPAEEKEAREELLEQTASHLGIPTSTKFFVDKLVLALCALALQGPGGVWKE